MADTKLTALSELTSVADDDLLYIVDVTGTPTSKKITVLNALKALLGTSNAIPKFDVTNVLTDSSITDDGTTVAFAIKIEIDGNISTSAEDLGHVFKTTSFSNKRMQLFFTDNSDNTTCRLGNDLDGLNENKFGVRIGTNPNPAFTIDDNDNAEFINDLSILGEGSTNKGIIGGYNQTSLGTNPTTLDVEGSRTLNVTAAVFTANTTLTLSNVSNLFDFTIQLTNTNANVITFVGITVYFKSDDLPTGVTFASNALTFPADSSVKYNIVGVKFDGSTFDCKIEIR